MPAPSIVNYLNLQFTPRDSFSLSNEFMNTAVDFIIRF
jgi:hypothetical protein